MVFLLLKDPFRQSQKIFGNLSCLHAEKNDSPRSAASERCRIFQRRPRVTREVCWKKDVTEWVHGLQISVLCTRFFVLSTLCLVLCTLITSQICARFDSH